MQLSGGGIGSSSVVLNSCSIASRTTCATDTPRSRARRLARSISSGSAWIIILCIIGAIMLAVTVSVGFWVRGSAHLLIGRAHARGTSRSTGGTR